MTENRDMDDLLERNPQIDQSELEKLREALRRIREQGPARREYELEPLGGRRVTVREDVRTDTRIVRLKRESNAI